MAIKTIGLSFKNTPEDKALYDWIYTHSNISGFIKDILRKEMKGSQEAQKPPRGVKKGLDIDF